MPRPTQFENEESARYRQSLDGVCAGILERHTRGLLTFAGDAIVSRGSLTHDHFAAQPQGECPMRRSRSVLALLIAIAAIGLAMIAYGGKSVEAVNSSPHLSEFYAVSAAIDADTPAAVPANRDAQCVAVDLIDRSDQSAIAEPPCATVDQHAWRPAPNPAPLPGALLLTSQARRGIPVALLFERVSPLPQFRQPLLL